MYVIKIQTLKNYVLKFIAEAIEKKKINIDYFNIDTYLCYIKIEVKRNIRHAFEYSNIGFLDKAIMEEYCNTVFSNEEEIRIISGYIEIRESDVDVSWNIDDKIIEDRQNIQNIEQAELLKNMEHEARGEDTYSIEEMKSI